MGTHLLLCGASLHRIHIESRIVQSNSLPIHPDMLLYGSQNLRFKKDEPPEDLKVFCDSREIFKSLETSIRNSEFFFCH